MRRAGLTWSIPSPPSARPTTSGFVEVLPPSGGAGPVGIGLFPEAPLQHPTLLRGTGIRLMDVTDYAGVGATRNVHAAAAGDLDGDGDLDLALLENVTNGVDGRLVILRNLASAGNALTVRAQGLGAARDGIGARVEVWVGGRRVVKRVDGSLSMLANGPNEVHVGLGTATFADRVIVRFRSGAVVTRTHVPAGRITFAEE